MSYQLPVSIQQIIDLKMSTGIYESQDSLLLEALNSLDDFEQSVADIQEGIEDEAAGRVKSIAEVDREIRQELGFSQ
jgi:Arc/MetJ-type ribon-helix-helix transcriptional regulator